MMQLPNVAPQHNLTHTRAEHVCARARRHTCMHACRNAWLMAARRRSVRPPCVNFMPHRPIHHRSVMRIPMPRKLGERHHMPHIAPLLGKPARRRQLMLVNEPLSKLRVLVLVLERFVTLPGVFRGKASQVASKDLVTAWPGCCVLGTKGIVRDLNIAPAVVPRYG